MAKRELDVETSDQLRKALDKLFLNQHMYEEKIAPYRDVLKYTMIQNPSLLDRMLTELDIDQYGTNLKDLNPAYLNQSNKFFNGHTRTKKRGGSTDRSL